ncbi:hypothetical protein CBER1_11081 [Cercospora berteroae]|uniref:Uncharacterized protein n=1 Tax=Cercospora berteroae TaxID=357750 RepID=A0A2S6BZP7_9PEZI|nr:hypothetical protein CBER1_11081 [Cercospora berteroae]
MSSIRVSPSAEDYNEEGFRVLRHCVAESHSMLQQGFESIKQEDNEEAARQQLRRILADAATKRFHVYKLYLQAQAAIRWASYRQKILQGQRPHAGHAQALAQLQANLRQELLSLSDQIVAALLRHADLQERKWIAEDPSVDEMGIWNPNISFHRTKTGNQDYWTSRTYRTLIYRDLLLDAESR